MEFFFYITDSQSLGREAQNGLFRFRERYLARHHPLVHLDVVFHDFARHDIMGCQPSRLLIEGTEKLKPTIKLKVDDGETAVLPFIICLF